MKHLEQLNLFEVEQKQMRTGFPRRCPVLKSTPTGARCAGCEHHIYTDRGTWLCGLPVYQNAAGVHFCLACQVELSPNNERLSLRVCGWDGCRRGRG